MNSECVLEVNNLTKDYKVRKSDPIKAIDDISFKAYKGEILGLLGPNGAGKTTTVKSICSLIKPTGGSILIKGIDNQKNRNKSLRTISAVLEGNRNIYWRLTVRENLEFFASLKGVNPKKIKDKIDYYIEFFNLKDKDKEITSKLSRGMQQKLAIATTLISGSEIVLLDEPTLGLDVKASYDIRDILKKIAKEENRTIILTTHDMNVVQDVCDRVIIVNNGKIITEGTTNDLLQLFNIKTYSLIIQGTLSSEIKNKLLQVPHLKVEQKEHVTEIIVSIEESKTFYHVINILSTDNCEIDSIEKKQVNFEKVFVELIGRSDSSAE